jgi:hypothetical protein
MGGSSLGRISRTTPP